MLAAAGGNGAYNLTQGFEGEGVVDDGGDASGGQVLRVPDRGGERRVRGSVGARLLRPWREYYRGGRGSGEPVRARLRHGRGQKGIVRREEQAPGRDRLLPRADGSGGEGAAGRERGFRDCQGRW